METDIVRSLAEYGAFAILTFFIVRYFMSAIKEKDNVLVGLTREALTAIQNNTEAMRELKESLKEREEHMNRQHEKLANMMQIATSSINNNTAQLKLLFDIKNERN